MLLNNVPSRTSKSNPSENKIKISTMASCQMHLRKDIKDDRLAQKVLKCVKKIKA